MSDLAAILFIMILVNSKLLHKASYALRLAISLKIAQYTWDIQYKKIKQNEMEFY